ALAVIAATTTVALPDPAHGNQISTGSIEFSPTVAFSHWNMKREGYGNVDNFTRLDITPTIGYCMSNHSEVTGALMTRHESAIGVSATGLGANAGRNYNLYTQGAVFPFDRAGY